MATTVAEIQAKLDLATGQFDAALAGTTAKLQAASGSMGKHFSNISSQAQGAFSGIASGIQRAATAFAVLATGTSFGAAKFIGLAGELQTTQARMAALTGSTEAAGKALGEIYTYVLGKPIAFPDAAKAAQTLMGYGRTTQQVVSDIKTLSAFSIVNGSDMGQLALAYGQVTAKGHLMGQEVIQMVNNFVPLSQVIAKHFNIPLAEAQARIESGTITAEDFTAAMREFIPEDAIAKQSNTFKNRMISLQGSIRSLGLALIGVHVDPQLGLVVESGGLFDRLSNFIPKISAALKDMKPALVGAMGFLLDHWKDIAAIILGIAAGFVAAKVAAFAFWVASLGPVALIAAGVVLVIGVLTALQARFGILNPIISAVGAVINFVVGALTKLWNSVSGFVVPALSLMGYWISQMWNLMVSQLKPALDQIMAAIQPWIPILQKVAMAIGIVLVAAIVVFVAWTAILIGVVLGVAAVFAYAVNMIMSVWNATFGRLYGIAANAINSVLNTIRDVLNNIFRTIGSFNLESAGRALINTFANGIRHAMNDAVNAVKEGVGKIRDLLPGSDAKTGPLSELTASGRALFPTFAKGVAQGADAVNNIGSYLSTPSMGLVGASGTGVGAGGIVVNQTIQPKSMTRREQDMLIENAKYAIGNQLRGTFQ